MGVVRYKRGDLKAFVRYAKRALEIDQSSDAAALLAFVLAETGITDDARRYAEMALYRDPLSFFAYWGGWRPRDLSGTARSRIGQAR